jgi:hypothetical protein
MIWHTRRYGYANFILVPGEVRTRYENCIDQHGVVVAKVVLQIIQERHHRSLRQLQMEADAGSTQTFMPGERFACKCFFKWLVCAGY